MDPLVRHVLVPSRLVALSSVRSCSRAAATLVTPKGGATEHKDGSESSGWRRFTSSLILPTSVGMLVLMALTTRRSYQRRQQRVKEGLPPLDLTLSPEAMRWIRVLPLRSLSRLASRLQHVVIPTYLRTPLFGSFRMMYRMDPETIDRPLAEYRTPNEFFARSIPNGVRPIAPSPMVSPVDGRIQDLGELSDDHDTVWKIKGLSHSIMSFLGEPPHQRKHGSRYYYMIVYLTPGDYHRFHSPSDWTIHHRRHFPGNTHPVNPWYSIFVPGVLSLNERIVLAGTWKGGHTYLGAVGAMFVNSIQLDIEQELRTNVPSQDDMARMGGRSFLHHYDGRGIVSSKGSPLGKFNLGSTIVLVFECTGFQWTVSTGERVKMGQPLGEVA